MAGRTMPTECEGGPERTDRFTRAVAQAWMKRFPAEAVAQLAADRVLVERECQRCSGWLSTTCSECGDSGKDGYDLVLPDGEEESDE